MISCAHWVSQYETVYGSVSNWAINGKYVTVGK